MANCLKRSIPVLSSTRKIAIYDYGGDKVLPNSPTVLYVPGFQGSGHGSKSQAFIRHCQKVGLRYVCYDPEGTGESKINDYYQLEFRHWFEDAEAAIRASKAEKLIVIGSSMGGWISLKIANAYPGLIHGLLLIAPAVNFLRPKYELWYKNSSQEVQKEQDEGKATIMNPAYGSVPVYKKFVDKSAEMELDMRSELDIQCPVKIIHGVQDDTIHYMKSLDVMKLISTPRVELTFLKAGDHQMATCDGIELALRSLSDLVAKV